LFDASTEKRGLTGADVPECFALLGGDSMSPLVKEQFTGKPAVLEGDGRTFDELAEQRREVAG
jgi:hypothetical protein